MSKKDQKPTSRSQIDRRGFLKATAGTAAGLYAMGAGPGFGVLAPAFAEDKQPIGNYPVKGDKVVYGFAPGLTGSYSTEGEDEMRAYKLAVEHLNNGGGMVDTMNPTSLKGNGVLGKEVTYVTGDSATDPDVARKTARRMIERDGVIVFGGGASSSVAIAQQELGQEKGVICMTALTHSSWTTGKDRRRYGFRHFFHDYQTGMALSPVLAKEFGSDRRAFHLTADYSWGHSQQASMQEFTEKEGWTTVDNIYTPLGEKDYSQYLTAFLNSDADVLVLNHYGQDAANSMAQAARFRIRDLEKNGKKVEVACPMFSALVARGAGDAAAGVLTTINWYHTLEDPGSQAFTKAFMEKYDRPPSQAAQTCYVQMMLFSDAAERAGSFYPPDMIKALEDHRVEGVGPGELYYRGCDHQAFHDVLVVRAKATDEQQHEFDQFEIVRQVPRDEVMYDCDLLGGELGPYIPA